MADATPQPGPTWMIRWKQGGSEHSLPLLGRVTIGRAATCDIVVDDPYVSRVHCVLILEDGAIRLDASAARNPVRVDGKETAQAVIDDGATNIDVGKTSFVIVAPRGRSTDTTLKLTRQTVLTLRASTRELSESSRGVVAQFPAAEFAAFAAITRRYPDAANHRELGRAVWGDFGYDQYQIHRLIQRLRQRLGPLSEFLENVRGEGYRFHLPVEHI